LIILGLDTTSKTCSVALLEGDNVIAEYTQNLPRTHSEKLMPLIDTVFRDTGYGPKDLDAVAVSRGPGSFTGLRIGVSTARALTQGLGLPAAGICTLEVLARGAFVGNNLVCPVLDARKSQVYTALYRFNKSFSNLEILQGPFAVSIESLLELLSRYHEPVVFNGDGVIPYGEIFKKRLKERYLHLPHPLSYPRASLVAWCALKRVEEGIPLTSYLELKPLYLRVSEAERAQQRE